MNAGNLCKIIVLTAIFGMGGCSSIKPRYAGQSNDRSILSAEQAESMIQVTVTTLPPVEDQETAIAANLVD